MDINECGVKYEIAQLEDVDNNPSCLGLCIYKDSLIQLKQGLSFERKKQIVMHKLLHAMLYEVGYEEHDETLVSNLSIVINQVIGQNDIKATLKELE